MSLRKSAILPSSTVFLLVILILGILPILAANHGVQRSVSSSPLGFSTGIGRLNSFAPPASASAYDEQVGLTLTQSFSVLAFNVTAVAFTDNNVGPGYLVNGLTNLDYWYQVGLSYNWPMQNGVPNFGFSMNYEVFDPNDNSIYPASGGGIQSFVNGTVNLGDIVLLSLTFSSGNVVMSALDWQSGAAASTLYPAYTSNDLFIGLPSGLDNSSHFFTGLMTEQYHSSPYYGAGFPVTYSETGFALSTAWLWMDEFDATGSAGTIFHDSTTQAVPLSVSLGHYFASNGTAEIATSHELVTGLTPITFPTVSSSPSALARIGYQASVPILVNDSNQGGTVRFPDLTISASFGRYNSSSETPFEFNMGTTLYRSPINIPSGLNPGNYNLTIAIGSWQFLDSQAEQWIPLRPASFNESLTLTNNPIPPSNPGPTPPSSSNGPSTKTNSARTTISLSGIARSLIIPAALAYLSLAILAAALLVRESRESRKSQPGSILVRSRCQGCGSEVIPGMLACSICGLAQQQLNPINDVPVGASGSV